ncbi:MAG: bifunctional methylenetetrahydrofolate dehydrogenase/methenyltetrahydrofolate cyclohydrolase [Chloroflexi bacterium]|nr:bifunctional methylenetetrahydrofolate dehydrogenase/methenyltetrahydrofolate cyclohydrolase [Chloroflexota bacterium]|tara:strand:+ start:7225 stop:8055 length:831 start_codon:yes stop_codon:yes gene_type:complete
MTVIDGKSIASDMLENCKRKISLLKENGKIPYIEIILVGEDQESERYVGMKLKKIKDVGADGQIRKVEEGMTNESLMKIIDELNSDDNVNGILVQLPLPDGFETEKILSRIALEKDVDALNPMTLKKIDEGEESYFPAGVGAVLEIFERYKIKVEGKNITVIGISDLLGRPLASILRNRGADVREIGAGNHLTFEDLVVSDIVVTDVARPEWLKADMVKEGVVVIDAANNYIGGKVIGDVDFSNVSEKSSLITPVPGGVGPILIASLIENLVKSVE